MKKIEYGLRRKNLPGFTDCTTGTDKLSDIIKYIQANNIDLGSIDVVKTTTETVDFICYDCGKPIDKLNNERCPECGAR